MGLLDKRKPEPTSSRRRALDAARDHDEGVVTGLMHQILDRGLDGFGPYDSAFVVAEKARDTTVHRRRDQRGDAHVAGAGVGGFATASAAHDAVALPANSGVLCPGSAHGRCDRHAARL